MDNLINLNAQQPNTPLQPKGWYIKKFALISAWSAAVLFLIPNAFYFAYYGLLGGAFPFGFVLRDLLVNICIGMMIAVPVLFFGKARKASVLYMMLGVVAMGGLFMFFLAIRGHEIYVLPWFVYAAPLIFAASLLSSLAVNIAQESHARASWVLLLVLLAGAAYARVSYHIAEPQGSIYREDVVAGALCEIYKPSLSATGCEEIVAKITDAQRAKGYAISGGGDRDPESNNLCYAMLAWRSRDARFCNYVLQSDYSQIGPDMCQKIAKGSRYSYNFVLDELRYWQSTLRIKETVQQCAGSAYEEADFTAAPEADSYDTKIVDLSLKLQAIINQAHEEIKAGGGSCLPEEMSQCNTLQRCYPANLLFNDPGSFGAKRDIRGMCMSEEGIRGWEILKREYIELVGGE